MICASLLVSLAATGSALLVSPSPDVDVNDNYLYAGIVEFINNECVPEDIMTSYKDYLPPVRSPKDVDNDLLVAPMRTEAEVKEHEEISNGGVISHESDTAAFHIEQAAVTDPVAEVDMAEEPVTYTGANRWGITLTEYETDLLARIVYLEAGCETARGQQAVITVIFNRMVSPEFPSNLEAVLSQKGQFSTWKNRAKALHGEKELANINAVISGAGLPDITGQGWLFFNCIGGGTRIDNQYFR